jgi:hypothetical protein
VASILKVSNFIEDETKSKPSMSPANRK